MNKKVVTSLITGLTLVGMSHLANAALFGYELTISGSSNVPTFTLTNTGSTDIIGYSLTIGNTEYNWDAAYHEIDNDLVGYSLEASLDANDGGGLRSDIFEYSFTDFQAGNVFIHDADVDKDSYNSGEDYRSVLWNNDLNVSNALLTVSFLGSEDLSMILPDEEYASTYTFTQSGGAPVPEPTTMLLFGTGLIGLVGCRIKKRNN